MTKRRLRLILLGFLFITLLLPVTPAPPPQRMSIWLYSTWCFLNLLAAIPSLIAEPGIGRLLLGIGSLLDFLAIQILILFNLFLCGSARLRKLERLYRIFLVVLFFVVWGFVLFIVDPYRGIGYWANPVMVTVAALMEIGFVIHKRSRKPLNLNP